MAGFFKIYVIGGPGGFRGSDGVNPIYFQILVGTSSRQWWEPHYFMEEIKPMGKLRVIVPAGPDDPDSLGEEASACSCSSAPASPSSIGWLLLVLFFSRRRKLRA